MQPDSPSLSYSPWIVVGDSPSGAEGLARAVDRHRMSRTVTTNGAWRHFNGDRPDVYLLFAADPTRQYKKQARAFRDRGTRLVTVQRNERSLKQRGVEDFDEFLKLTGGAHMLPRKFQHGRYTDAGLSGLLCLQYAVNNGATHVALCGMEGYTAEHDGPKLARHSNTLIEPFMQEVVDVCPDVQFTLYGTLQYKLTGSNVEIIPC